MSNTLRVQDTCLLCSIGCSYCSSLFPEVRKAEYMFISYTPLSEQEINYVEQLFKQVLGVNPEQVYITSVIKCVTEPEAVKDEHIDVCVQEYFTKEIELVAPKILVFSGVNPNTESAHVTIEHLRGKFYTYDNIPYVVTYAVEDVMNAGGGMLKAFASDIDKAITSVDVKENPQTVFTQVKVLKHILELDELIENIKKTGMVCLDIETTGLSFWKDKITLLGLSYQMGGGYAIPLHHSESPFSEFEIQALMKRLNKEVFGNSAIRKTAWNTKFDYIFLKSHFKTVFEGRIDDAMLMHHLLDENNSHKLKENAALLFPGYTGYDREVKKKNWSDLSLDVLIPYCITDADLTLRLTMYYESLLVKEPKLYNLYRNLTIPTLKLLTEAEFNGMLVNTESMNKFIQDVDILIEADKAKLRAYPEVQQFELDRYTDKLEVVKTKVKAICEAKNKDYEVELEKALKKIELEPLNFNSPAQVNSLLYSGKYFRYEMPYDWKTKTRKASVNKKILNRLIDKTGFITVYLGLKQKETIQSRYLRGMVKFLHGNLIHTSFLIHGTVTGRLSSANPNMQNIPRGGEVGGLVKQIFVAPEGYKLIQADFSQAELRIAAYVSKDPVMLQAYKNGEDLHTLTAMTILSIDLEKWQLLDAKEQKKHRTNAKSANFGLLYGMGAESYRQYAYDSYGVVLSEHEAENNRTKFFSLYKNLKNWHKMYEIKAKKHGFVETLFGRKRRLIDIHSNNNQKKSAAIREAINAPIQGTGGEFTLFAACILKQRLDDRVILVNTVHDSLLYYVPCELEEEAVEIIKQTCAEPLTREYFGFSLSEVNMQVDVETGTVWGLIKT